MQSANHLLTLFRVLRGGTLAVGISRLSVVSAISGIVDYFRLSHAELLKGSENRDGT